MVLVVGTGLGVGVLGSWLSVRSYLRCASHRLRLRQRSARRRSGCGLGFVRRPVAVPRPRAGTRRAGSSLAARRKPPRAVRTSGVPASLASRIPAGIPADPLDRPGPTPRRCPPRREREVGPPSDHRDAGAPPAAVGPLQLAIVTVALLAGGALFLSGFSLGARTAATPGTPASDADLFLPFWDVWDSVTKSYVGEVDRRSSSRERSTG